MGGFLDPYRLARSLCLAGAAAAQVQAIDTVYVDFRNEAGLRRECEEARRDGFTGKMAIHPAQVAIINEVFTPTAEAIAKARGVVAAFAAASRRRRHRHRWHDVRPPASRARQAIAGADKAMLSACRLPTWRRGAQSPVVDITADFQSGDALNNGQRRGLSGSP